jgi:tetratricopeptide (TPR) repeat protein
MTPESTSRLDDEELLHLAIEASRNQRHADAIHFLKEAAAKSTGNAKVHYLLGAEHAQIGLIDRAEEDMATALELDPSLVPARFQLGLLFLVRGKVANAMTVWEALEKLDDSDPYLHFKRGLEYLAQDDFARCQESLALGMSLNRANPPLNRDMLRIVDEVKARTSAPAAASQEPASAPHVLLSGYTGSRR